MKTCKDLKELVEFINNNINQEANNSTICGVVLVGDGSIYCQCQRGNIACYIPFCSYSGVRKGYLLKELKLEAKKENQSVTHLTNSNYFALEKIYAAPLNVSQFIEDTNQMLFLGKLYDEQVIDSIIARAQQEETLRFSQLIRNIQQENHENILNTNIENSFHFLLNQQKVLFSTTLSAEGNLILCAKLAELPDKSMCLPSEVSEIAKNNYITVEEEKVYLLSLWPVLELTQDDFMVKIEEFSQLVLIWQYRYSELLSKTFDTKQETALFSTVFLRV